MRDAQSRPWWTVPVRALLAAMWLVHGLEKFGVKWPVWLGGGTQSVPDMLQLMAEETPIPLVRWLIEGLMLPGADLLQYPVGVLEISLGLAIAAGFLLPWASALGAGIQFFFFLGFVTLEWPLQYPLVVVAHVVLGAPAWLRRVDPGKALPLLQRVSLSGVWLYTGLTASPWLLVLALLPLAGLFHPLISRAGSLLSMLFVLVAFQHETWGSWPWNYYVIIAGYIALLLEMRPTDSRWVPPPPVR